MNPFIALLSEAAQTFTDALVAGLKKPDEVDDDEFDVEPQESDEVRDLRIEYGYMLLAEQGKVEQLEHQRDQLQTQLRRLTRILQKAFTAHEIMRETLYEDYSSG